MLNARNFRKHLDKLQFEKRDDSNDVELNYTGYKSYEYKINECKV